MTDEFETPKPTPGAPQDSASRDAAPVSPTPNAPDALRWRETIKSFDTSFDDAAELDSVLSQIEALAQTRPPPVVLADPEPPPAPPPVETAQDVKAEPATAVHTTSSEAVHSVQAGAIAPVAPLADVPPSTPASTHDASAAPAPAALDAETSAAVPGTAGVDKGDGDKPEPTIVDGAGSTDGIDAKIVDAKTDDSEPIENPADQLEALAAPGTALATQDNARAPTPAACNWNSSLWDIAALIVIVATAFIALATFRDYGMGWDDYTHSEYGELLRQLFVTKFQDTRALSFVNLYYYGGGFDLAAASLAKVLPFSLFETRRLAGAIVGVIAVAITWRLGRRLGGPSGGFFAAISLVLLPVFYGHMFMNPKDVPFAMAMALMLLGFVRAFEDYPRLSPATIVILGLGAGLAVGTRVLAGFWIVAALIAFAVLLVGDFRAHGKAATGRLMQALVRLAPSVVLAVAVMALVWPWVATSAKNLFSAIAYFDVLFEKPWPELFGGTPTLISDMPWTYLPVMFAHKLPEIVLVLVAGGIIGTLVALAARDVTPKRKAILLLVLLAALLPPIAAMISHPALYNGIRHFIFVLPAMAALAGLCASWVLMRASSRGVIAMTIAALLMLAPFALPVMAMARLHPFEYAYYNDAGGGVRKAEGRFMIDYWGLSFKQASDALRALLQKRGEAPSGGKPWKVAVCGPTRAAEVFLGPRFDPGAETKGADFAITLGEFYCQEPDLPVTITIARDGHVFARVYDVRGIPLKTLDRFPPVRAPAKPAP